jgi:hypothetical protein
MDNTLIYLCVGIAFLGVSSAVSYNLVKKYNESYKSHQYVNERDKENRNCSRKN